MSIWRIIGQYKLYPFLSSLFKKADVKKFLLLKPCIQSLGPFSAPNDSLLSSSISHSVIPSQSQNLLLVIKQQRFYITLGNKNTKPKFPSPCSRQLLDTGLQLLFHFVLGLVAFLAPRGSVFALNSFTSTWENHMYCLDYFLLKPSAMVQPFALESCYLHVSRVTTVQRHIAQSRLQSASKKRQQGSQMYKSCR